jgi:hypothetical protein
LAIFNHTRIPCSNKNSDCLTGDERNLRRTAGRTPYLNRSKNSSRSGFAVAFFYAHPAKKISGDLKLFILGINEACQ